MSSYFPPTVYERLPDYGDSPVGEGIPLYAQSPQSMQTPQSLRNPQSAQRQRQGSSFSSTAPTYYDHEALLEQPTQYSPHSPPTPQTPFPHPTHRESAIYLPPAKNQLRHQYRRIKQFRRISLRILARWLLSCVLAAATTGLFMQYQHKGVLNGTEKHVFNALYLGVSLMYGLNLVASFKSMALIFRWKVLASTAYGGHSAKELDLILGMSSYGTATRLLKHWRGKPKYFIFMASWILLGITAQVGLAALGLTFNHDNEGAQRIVPGLVNSTKLNFYQSQDPNEWPMYFAQNYVAHLYGDTSINLLDRNEGEKLRDDQDYNSIDLVYVNATNEFKYYFEESAYNPQGRDRMAKSKRFVTIATKCKWSPIVTGQLGDGVDFIAVDTDGDGTSKNLTEHPWVQGESGQSTTLYGNPSLGANATELQDLRDGGTNIADQPSCGPRCGITYVYRFIRSEEISDDVDAPYPNGDFFNCSTTISQVHGAIIPQHMMSDQLARNAAAAIGSNVIWKWTEDYTFQSATYNSASRWDNWQGRTGAAATNVAEYNIARFATGSLAILDESNRKIEMPGMRPEEGVVLSVKWIYVWLTWGLLLGTQFVVGVVTVVKGNTVFCKDESFLSTARLLRPLVDRLGDNGSSADGAEIAEMFGNTHMRYGVRRDTGMNRLDILMDSPADGKEGHGGVNGVGWPRGYYE